jgi:malate dehydrogenase
MPKSLRRIAVTGSAGQVAYSLLFRIANGELFGSDQPIALHLLETSDALSVLEGVKMELEDGAYPLLKEIHLGSDPYTIFGDVQDAFLLGAKPRSPGMERKDLLLQNAKIFADQGKALHASANDKVRVFVVGNPCNTNCLIAMNHAPKLSKSHFFALTRLDQNRATFQLAKQAKVSIENVTNMGIWGNHSSTQIPDFYNARIQGQLVPEVIHDHEWLQKDFMMTVQKRGAAVLNARGKSSSASAAQAIIDSVHDILKPTDQDRWFSMAIYSSGNPYGIEDDLVFSFPCRSKGDGLCEIVTNLSIHPFIRARLSITEKELIEERECVREIINRGDFHG